MRFFGQPWGPAAEDRSLMIKTPVGEVCRDCGETIAEGDLGCVEPHVLNDGHIVGARHRECFLRLVFGSVGHQLHLCPCYGGQFEDPPEMTRREAARAAVNLQMMSGSADPIELRHMVMH